VVEANRGGPRGAEHYSPPWENGFDVCFSTEAKVPTWDPMKNPETGKEYGTHYWKEDGTRETENLEGDDSRVIMDRVLPFIRNSAENDAPFFAVIWFHTPHNPVVAGPEYLERYKDQPEEKRHYYGSITAMDEQFGRLRGALRDLGIDEKTMLWFCADNGPEGKTGEGPGSAGPFRGRKRDLLEGGIRVPAILEWPGRIGKPGAIETPCCTSDYFPTILEYLGSRAVERTTPVDGISLVPFIEGNLRDRPAPIAFESGTQLALIDNRYKIYSSDGGKTYSLCDVIDDPHENTDLSEEQPEVLRNMREELERWRASCKNSSTGKDYR
jgi:arylsulfatase A-like enzyme